MTRIKFLIIIVLSSLFGSGCSINQLTHEGLSPQAVKRSGTVVLADKAEGLNGSKVGWGRITLFAIPVVPIYIGGDESIQLMENIQEALTLAGYTAPPLGASPVNGGPVLHATVNRLRYSNYTWLVPFIPTWGGMSVTLSLVDKNGKVAWTREFTGKGFTMNFTDGYNIASRESMSEMLDAMVVAFISDDFYNAAQAVTVASNL